MILGVIAALTLPALNRSTNKNELISMMKKEYSSFSNAADLMAQREGDIKYWDWTDILETKIKLYLNITKSCAKSTGCFPDVTYKKLDGNPGINFNSSGDYYKYALTDGSSVAIAAATGSGSAYGLNDNINGIIIVDVNGQKGPNQIGRDTFLFAFVNGKGILPGGADSQTGCSARSSDGYNCAAYVLKESKIP